MKEALQEQQVLLLGIGYICLILTAGVYRLSMQQGQSVQVATFVKQ